MNQGPELPASVPVFSADTIGTVGTLTLIRATERSLINDDISLLGRNFAPHTPGIEAAQAALGRFYSLTAEIGAVSAESEEPGSPEAERRTLVERFLSTAQRPFEERVEWPGRPSLRYKSLLDQGQDYKVADLVFADNFDPEAPPLDENSPLDEQVGFIGGRMALSRLMIVGWELSIQAEYGRNATGRKLVVQEFLRRSITNMGGRLIPKDQMPWDDHEPVVPGPLKAEEGNDGK